MSDNYFRYRPIYAGTTYTLHVGPQYIQPTYTMIIGSGLYNADDIMLMSDSFMQLQKMLNIFSCFGKACDLKFNVQKSCCGIIGKLLGMCRHNILIDNAPLPRVDKITYLGVTFIAGNTLLMDCKPRIQKFISAVCSVMRCKTVGLEYIFVEILIEKCLPILFYRLERHLLDSTSKKSVNQALNMSFKWLYNLRKYDTTRLLFLINKAMSPSFIFDQKLLYVFIIH